MWTLDETTDYFTEEHIIIFIIGLLFLTATVIYTQYILVIGLKPYLMVCGYKQTDAQEYEIDNDHDLHCCNVTRTVTSKLLKCMDMPLPVYNALCFSSGQA